MPPEDLFNDVNNGTENTQADNGGILNKEAKLLMQKHGITRLEAVEIIAEILKEDQEKK